MMVAKLIQHRFEIMLCKFRVRLSRVQSLEQALCRGMFVEVLGQLPREQHRKERGSIFRELEQCFVHQVFEHVLPANIDDERELRTQRSHVSEVLVRADTQVDATWFRSLAQIGDNMLERALV